MGLFRKKDRGAAGRMFTEREKREMFEQMDAPVHGASGFDAITGDAFRSSLRNGVVPPEGWTFTNRFLNNDPAMWSGAVIDSIPHGTPLEDIHKSLMALVVLLQGLEEVGASLPEWQAAEDAVTINLTAFTVALAGEIASRHVDAMAEKWGAGQSEECAWFDDLDAGLWLLCEEIRAEAKAAEPSARFSPEGRAATGEHPSEMLKGVIGAVVMGGQKTEHTIDFDPSVP